MIMGDYMKEERLIQNFWDKYGSR